MRLRLMGTKSLTDSLLNWAVHLATNGWAVFPLWPGTKRPAIRNWECRATTDLGRIRRCWSTGPYNIGLACGPSGLVVLDLDQPKPGEVPPESWSMLGIANGVDVLEVLAQRAGQAVPDTYMARSASGGMHLYFRAPGELQLRNTSGRLGWKVDTRARGGYVVAPGSVLPTGGYELVDDRDPVVLPGWLAQALADRPSTAKSAAAQIAPERVSRYVRAAVEGELDYVRAAQRGRHNKTLFVAACRLGELVAGGGLDYEHAYRMLQQAAAHMVAGECDCTQRQVDATIASGLRAGATHPRRLATWETAA